MIVRMFLTALLGAAVLPACAQSGAPVLPSESSAPATAQAPFDVGAVVRQVGYAFGRDQGAWRGGDATYAVRVLPSELELRPFTHQAGSRLEGAPLTLAPARVTRGEAPLPLQPARVAQRPDGTLDLDRGAGVRERLINGEGGVEQSWSFEARPSGEGDLLVEIGVGGLAYSGVTRGGLHFQDPHSGLGFRYGHGTWIDATGVRTQVPARFAEGRIILRVDAETLEASRFPAVLDPVISPEFGMDAPVYGPSGLAYGPPAVASNGTDYLVVWEDGRGGTIYGTRVSSAGVVQENTGIPISSGLRGSRPAVASNGTDYLVAWQINATNTTGGTDLRGARVSSAGVVLDPTPLFLATQANNQVEAAVASNGTNYYLAWTTFLSGGSTDVHGMLVLADGSVTGQRALTTVGNMQYQPSVASNGTDYFVVWTDTNPTPARMQGTSVSGSTGVSAVTDGFAVNASGVWGRVGSNGTDYLVVWANGAATDTQDIFGAVVPAGATTPGSTFLISGATGRQHLPAVASAGADFQVVWKDARNGTPTDPYGSLLGELYGARVSGAGAVLDSTGVQLGSGTQLEPDPPAIASSASGSLLVWGARPNVRGTRISTGGVAVDPTGLDLSITANQQVRAAVATNGTDFLVTWVDYRDPFGIYAARVNAEGTVLDPSGITLATGVPWLYLPSVASNGSDYLVAWEQRPASGPWEVRAARLSSAGVVLDPAGLRLGDPLIDAASPAVASVGSDYLVAWRDPRQNVGAVLATRITAAGALLDGNGLTVSANESAETVTLASSASGYLVVWSGRDPAGITRVLAYGARVSTEGVVLDTPKRTLGPSYPNSAFGPTVASDGTGFLVAWHELGVVSARMLDATGAAVRLLTLPARVDSRSGPIATCNAGEYLLAWTETGTVSRRVMAVRVSGAGVVRESTAIPLTPGGAFPENPAICAAGPDRYLLAYTDLDERATHQNYRVLARFITFPPPPVASNSTVATPEDTPVATTLQATASPGSGALTYALVGSAVNGAVSLSGAVATFSPTPNFHGTASFQFKARSDGVDSNTATVTVTVSPVNDAPVAGSQTLTVATPSLDFALGATDVDGDPLEFTIVTPPANGTLSGTPPALTFQPTAGFSGTTSLTFTASDGIATSNQAQVVFEVTAPPFAVSILPEQLAAAEGQAVQLVAQLSPDGLQGLTYAWEFGDGSAGTGQEVSHVYADDGPVTVTVTVTDGEGRTATATREFGVGNLPPVPTVLSALEVRVGATASATFSASDPAGERDPLTWTLLEGPGSVTASGSWSWATGTQAPGTFTVRAQVTDDGGASAESSFQVRVLAAEPEPEPEPEPSGCGCSSGAGASSLWSALALVLAGVRRRRRVTPAEA